MTRERVRARRMALATAGFLSWALSLAGCNDNDLGIDSRRPNRPPETVLSSGPPDSTNFTSYRVQLFWSGSDPDGTIDHFDYILVDHPASDSTITGGENDPNRVIVRIPEKNDPRWTSTNSNDTLIVTRADTLRRDPRPDPGDPTDNNEVVRTTTFERWHTFFIRAVDNEGIEDVSPEYRSFNARTIAPTVELLPPIVEGIVFTGPRTIVFNWNGSDPIGDGNSIEPVAARWVLIPAEATLGGWIGYPDSLYYLPHGYAWSQWYAWDRSDGRGRQAIIRNLLPANPENPRQGDYLFAVQAMDEAGAVTPVFDHEAPGKNNVARVSVSDYVGSTLTVTERVLGTYNFVGGSRPVVLDMAAGQTIEFRWRGDASSYGGTITGYRYGWNIRNPQNDEEWDQNWNVMATKSVPRTFNAGIQRFFLECRDNAETVTHAEVELVVRQVTRSKDLLFVDDTEQPNAASEPEEDARWLQLFDALVDRRPSIDFQTSRDVYDVVENRYFPPPIARVFDYKTIVWSVVQGRSGSALKTLGLFFDPFLTRNQSQVPPFNYLSIYLDNGGELWLSGDQVGHIIWPVLAQPDVNQALPVNVTNWDDPSQADPPHPDSAGVTSLLWKLGVEMLDLGGGSRARLPRRDRIIHNCLGFRRSQPAAVQAFTSSVDQNHTHGITIRTADVETPPMTLTLTTSSAESHTHTVTIARADLQSLALGNEIIVTTSMSDVPSSHDHTFTLRDQQGLWGAASQLVPDISWALPPDLFQNPLGTRPNIEIYNHPLMLANPPVPPPLSPQPGIWLPLYLYSSGVPENPDTGTFWPLTADGSPSVILRKAAVSDQYYSRALCGFEPWRLRFESHLALADFILLRHMRLGLAE